MITLDAEAASPASFVSDLPSTAVLSSAEKLAAKLLEEADYPHASCLRPLRETRWPNQRIKRPSMKGSEKYQVLGQYSHSKFSRLTLATYRLPHTLQYLNHFVTTHGALGPRSSLAISRHATVEWSPTRTSTTWDRTSASPWAPSKEVNFGASAPTTATSCSENRDHVGGTFGLRHLGAPSLIITDGGKEFQGRFERWVGAARNLTSRDHSREPMAELSSRETWRLAEKQKLNQELDSGRQAVVSSKEDLDELLAIVRCG